MGSARFDFANFVEALAEALFEALVSGLIVSAAGEIVGEAGHVGDFIIEVVGIFVALAVADVFHEAGYGVANVEGHGLGFGLVNIVDDLSVGSVDGIGFWREREIDGGLGEGEMAFGRAEEIESVLSGESDGEGAGFGEADVFAGYAHHAPGEIKRVFAGFEHAHEPVKRGVRVGIADGFVESRDQVEMLFAGFVVAEEFSLQDVFEQFFGNDARAGFVRLRTAGGELERVVGGTGVAVGERGDTEEDVVGGLDGFVAEAGHGRQAVVFVVEGAAEKFGDLRRREGIEDVDFGAGEKWGDDFEGRILGGRADEDDVAGFDVGEEGVLLGFVEAMDFVDEDDRAMAGAGFMLGGGHDFLDFLDAGENGAERNEFGAGQARDQARQSGLTTARRSPEKHGAEIVVFDLHAKRFAGAEEFFLADEFVEGTRAHAFGERLVGGGHVGLMGERARRGKR